MKVILSLTLLFFSQLLLAKETTCEKFDREFRWGYSVVNHILTCKIKGSQERDRGCMVIGKRSNGRQTEGFYTVSRDGLGGNIIFADNFMGTIDNFSYERYKKGVLTDRWNFRTEIEGRKVSENSWEINAAYFRKERGFFRSWKMDGEYVYTCQRY